MNAQRAKTIGFLEPDVIEVSYKLTKAKSEQDAIAVLRDISREIYPALMKHMHEHRNLFLPEVHMAVAMAMDSPKQSKAHALFAMPKNAGGETG
jgi:hypothetical protein